MLSDIQQRVYQIVSNIPKGKVMTYGQVAKLVGIKSPRLVGRYLHINPSPENIPCHRVVNSKGFVARNYAFGGNEVQKRRLIEEGVGFVGMRVVENKVK
jgi:O-6-methylguanine DNA methyltransferase